jgi:hypothetical protein
MMNSVQGDCKYGALAFEAGEDLSAAAGLLVKLNAAGHVVKPSSVDDLAPYVVAYGARSGHLCGVVPLSSLANARVTLKGTCVPGDLLVPVGDGRVETGAGSDAVVGVGVAEEAGVDGQTVLLRPLAVGSVEAALLARLVAAEAAIAALDLAAVKKQAALYTVTPPPSGVFRTVSEVMTGDEVARMLPTLLQDLQERGVL